MAEKKPLRYLDHDIKRSDLDRARRKLRKAAVEIFGANNVKQVQCITRERMDHIHFEHFQITFEKDPGHRKLTKFPIKWAWDIKDAHKLDDGTVIGHENVSSMIVKKYPERKPA